VKNWWQKRLVAFPQVNIGFKGVLLSYSSVNIKKSNIIVAINIEKMRFESGQEMMGQAKKESNEETSYHNQEKIGRSFSNISSSVPTALICTCLYLQM
jgi:hypothetical protein